MKKILVLMVMIFLLVGTVAVLAEEQKDEEEIREDVNNAYGDGTYVPSSYSVQEVSGGYNFRNREGTSSMLKLGQELAAHLNYDTEMQITESAGGGKTIEFKGGASGLAQEFRIGEHVFRDIAQAKFELDADGNIKSAQFVANAGGRFVFDPEGKSHYSKRTNNMIFDTNPGDKVYVNFEEHTVAGQSDSSEPIRFEFKGNKVEAQTFQINFNDDGTFKEIGFTGGGSFTDAKGHTATSEKDLIIMFDGSDYDFNKLTNAIQISQNPEGYIIDLKGQVEYKNAVDYKGLSEDALTTYVMPNEGEKFFNVKRGDALVSNDAHSVLFKDGEVYLERNNLVDNAGEEGSFGFKYSGEDKVYTGKIDEAKNEMQLNAFKDGQQVDSKVIPFSEYDQAVAAQRQEQLVAARQELERLVAEGKITKEQADMHELGILNGENSLTPNLDKQIENLREYLSIPRSAEAEMNARMTLASKLAEQGSAEAFTEFESAQKLAESLGDRNAIYQINLGLGQAYAQAGNAEQASRAFSIASSYADSDQAKAIARAGAALVRAQEGDVSSVLHHLEQAMEYDPNNPEVASLDQQVVNSVLQNIMARIEGPEKEALLQAYEKKLGVTRAALETGDVWTALSATAEKLRLSVTQNPLKLLDSAFSPITGKIQHLDAAVQSDLREMGTTLKGTWALEQVNNAGLFRDYSNARTDIDRLNILASATGMGDSYDSASPAQQEALRDLKSAITYAEGKVPDLVALKSFGDSGSFNNPQSYFTRDSRLETGTFEVLFDEINVKNAFYLLVAPKMVTGLATRVAPYIPGTARATEALAALRTTIGESRVVQALSHPTYGIPNIGKFLLAEGAESGVGMAVTRLTNPEVGMAVEMIVGGTGVFDVAQTASTKAFKVGAVSVLDESGNVYRAGKLELNSLEAYMDFRKAADAGDIPGLKKIGDGLYEYNGKKIIPAIGDGMDLPSGHTVMADIDSPTLNSHFDALSESLAEFNLAQPIAGAAENIMADIPTGVGRGLGLEESAAFRQSWRELAENTAQISDNPIAAGRDLRNAMGLSADNIDNAVLERTYGSAIASHIEGDIARMGRLGNADVIEAGFKEIQETDLLKAAQITDPAARSSFLSQVYRDAPLVDASGHRLSDIGQEVITAEYKAGTIVIPEGIKISPAGQYARPLIDMTDYYNPGTEAAKIGLAEIDSLTVMEEVGHSLQTGGAYISPYTESFADWARANNKFSQAGITSALKIQDAIAEADIVGWAMHQDPKLVTRGLIENHPDERKIFVEYWNSYVVPRHGQPPIRYP
jgi:tetratricopeptide (TPR) repeat protein